MRRKVWKDIKVGVGGYIKELRVGIGGGRGELVLFLYIMYCIILFVKICLCCVRNLRNI